MGKQKPEFRTPTCHQPACGLSPGRGGWLPCFPPLGALGTPRGWRPLSSVPKAGSWAQPSPPVREASRLRFGAELTLPSLRELSHLETHPDVGETRSHFPRVTVTPRASDGHTYCPASGRGRRTAIRRRCAPVLGSVPLLLGASRHLLPGGQHAGHGKVGPAGTVCV